MIANRSEHSLVVVKNKLHAFGGNDVDNQHDTRCGVFDNYSKRSVALRSPTITRFNKAVSIKNKIFVFENFKSNMLIYDVDDEVWSKEKFEETNKVYQYDCVKLTLY